MLRTSRRTTSGLTLIELLVAIGAGIFVIGGVIILLARDNVLSRQVAEQQRITEDARTNIKRIEQAIRNAQDPDTDTAWIVPEASNDQQLTLYTRRGDSNLIQKVTYSLQGSELVESAIPRGPDGSFDPATATSHVLAASVRNGLQNVPLFSYEPAAPPENSIVGINLIIDTDLNTQPDAVSVKTAASPRLIKVGGPVPIPTPAPSPGVEPLSCSQPVDIVLVVDAGGWFYEQRWKFIGEALVLHRFNQPLADITGNVRIAAMQYSDSDSKVEVPFTSDFSQFGFCDSVSGSGQGCFGFSDAARPIPESIFSANFISSKGDLGNGIGAAHEFLTKNGRASAHKIIAFIASDAGWGIMPGRQPTQAILDQQAQIRAKADAAKAAGIEIFGVAHMPADNTSNFMTQFFAEIVSPNPGPSGATRHLFCATMISHMIRAILDLLLNFCPVPQAAV